MHLRPAFRKLAEAAGGLSALRVWRALTAEERRTAVLAFLADRPEAGRKILAPSVARALRFRESTVREWESAKLAGALATVALEPPHLALPLLISYLRVHRRSLLERFLDAIGVPHEEGWVKDRAAFEQLAAADDAAARLRAAAERCLECHDADDVALYLFVLRLSHPGLGRVLDPWLVDLARRAASDAVAAPLAPEPSEPRAEPEGPEPEDVDEFTTLDRILVYAIVDTRQGVEGALNEEELDDLLREVVELNGRRHRSYFHLGLRDVLFGRGPAADLPAENEDRRRWYWAGVVQGLARLDRWTAIVELYDREPVVRGLGDTGRGPSNAAAFHVARALCKADRHAEAAGFVSLDTLVHDPKLVALLLDEATRLLRKDRAAESRTLLDVLERAVGALTERGEDPARPWFLEIRRRRAHCYRQLGEFATARKILERLLEEDPSPDVRAMVLADLGLLDAGYRRLADLRLPETPDERAAFAEALERGRPKFEEAAALDAQYSAHARYALGMIALARGAWRDAAEHIEVALSVFAAEPERYGGGKLLAYARLYLGLALCGELQTERLTHAADLVRRGCEDGAALPRDRVEDVLTALEMRSAELAREVAETVLHAQGPGVLDALVSSGAAERSAAVARSLLGRADNAKRPERDRVRDCYAVLPGLLRHGMHEEAGRVLDVLEEKACAGIETQRFLDLLADPDRYQPAWESEDAFESRVRCLESAGRYEEAAVALAEKFHQTLASGRFGALEDAEALVERIRTYGLTDEHWAPLEKRLAAQRAVTGPTPTSREAPASERPRAPVRILFVGGDERQAQYDEEIERELAERAPHVRVTFVHPGWNSNWGPELERCRRELGRADGVVLMRFVRTEFGRRLRREIAVPWRGCGGHGKRAILNSILALAREVEARAAG
jgi:tetratricopeptide (TPR) repeat protein